MVKRTRPLDMTVCLPSWAMRNPIFREHPHRDGAADARKLGHGSNNNEIFFHLRHARFLCLNSEPLADGVFDVLHSFFPCVALRMATGQRWATHRPPFFGLNQANTILHGSLMAQLDWGCNACLPGDCLGRKASSGHMGIKRRCFDFRNSSVIRSALKGVPQIRIFRRLNRGAILHSPGLPPFFTSPEAPSFSPVAQKPKLLRVGHTADWLQPTVELGQ